MKIPRELLPFLLAAGALLAGCAAPRHGILDVSGKPRDPFADTNAAATVLIFISNDCPIANRYAPEIQRLQSEFAARRVNFWLVHADPDERPASIRRHAREYGLTAPELRDPDHKLMALSHAEVTPTAALFNSAGTLVYHGRIDDRFADLEKQRAEPTQRDLAEALNAVLAGRPVLVPVTQAVGCIISGPR